MELSYITAAGVFVGNVRGICRERIANVGVVVPVVTVVLPDAGNRDSVVVFRAKAQFIEQIGQIVNIGVVLKFPISVEQLEPVGTLTMFHQIIPAAGCRNVLGALGHGALMGDLQVFVSRGNDHGFVSSSQLLQLLISFYI